MKMIINLEWVKTENPFVGWEDTPREVVFGDDGYELIGFGFDGDENIGDVVLHKGKWIPNFDLDDDGILEDFQEKYPEGCDTLEEAKECVLETLDKWCKHPGRGNRYELHR